MIAAIPPSKPATAAINPATTPRSASGCSRHCRATHCAALRIGGISHWEVNAAFSSQCLAFHLSHQPMPTPELLFEAVSIADRGMTSPKRKEVAHG